jgi:hypothetical protein
LGCSVDGPNFSGALYIVVLLFAIGSATTFFALLRAIDNIGTTLKCAQAAAAAFAAVSFAVIGFVGFRSPGVECASGPLSFRPSRSFWAVVSSLLLASTFLLANGLYMTDAHRFTTLYEKYVQRHGVVDFAQEISERELCDADAGTAARDRGRIWFRAFWWDGILSAQEWRTEASRKAALTVEDRNATVSVVVDEERQTPG